jgi:transketolase
VLPIGGTFLVFADYMRPAVRLAALSGAKAVFVWSHDSVGVGEDGPTHQPVEHLASLRAIPGLQVIRPADGNETRRAWVEALRHDGPTALVLTRQGTPTVTDGSAVLHGAGTVGDHPDPDVVLIATGSEVATALGAASLLAEEGVGARVVSMPSWDRLERAPAELRDSLFPAGVPTVSVEAASTFGWHRWADACVGIDRFGASAPGGGGSGRRSASLPQVFTSSRKAARSTRCSSGRVAGSRRWLSGHSR